MVHQAEFVLLLGGVSGAGKTTAAIEISRHLGIPWLMVDDLRLAFQRSRVTLPTGTEALYFFSDLDERPHVWRESPERLRDVLIAVGKVMEPAIEVIIEHHLDQRLPVIIEGDGILPSVLQRPALQRRATHNSIHAVFIVEPSEEVLFTNMLTRARGISSMREADLRREARAKWLFGQWLTDEAQRLGLAVIESRPWESLVDRILQAGSTPTA